ncbi:MAG: alpha-L-fucosidase [Terriglobia bacterium]|jgi:alpha-L-fucosidase
MNRRRFINSLIGASAALPIWAVVAQAQLRIASHGNRKLAAPTANLAAWQDLEIGMFVHFAPNTWQDKEYDDLSTPLSAINPAQLDTDQWAQCAQGLGAKYIVAVAKHAGGFCMWQTETTDYGIRNTPWRGGKGDVMADLSRSCRKLGLRLGVYLSPQDGKFGAGTGGRCKTPELQATYNVLYRRQLTEVLSRYSEMVEIWFDGSLVTPVGDILKKWAPHAMIFQGPFATIRWVGNEDGFAPYPVWNAVAKSDAATGIATALHGDPDGDVWLPLETDVSIRRPDWFWNTHNERKVLSLDQLLEIYYRSVGRGTQLLLNIPADRRGLLPDADCARAREFGDEVRRRFGRSVAEARGWGEIVVLPLPSPTRVDHMILEEDCSTGQRIRTYRLEGQAQGKWAALGEGTAIGHKRIQPFNPGVVEAVRLIIPSSVGEPAIRRLAVFNTGSPPPRTWNAPAPVWADDAVGEWKNHRFSVDLSKKITAAGTYQLRFVPQGEDEASIRDVEFLLDGIPQPHLVRRVPRSSNVFILTLQGIGQRAEVKGQVRRANQGTILFRRY